MSRSTFTRAARRDLASAIRWIARDDPAAARALRNAVFRAAERLGNYPELGALRPEVTEAPYRFVALTGFPYIIVYNAARRPPSIVRVLHGARDILELLRSL